MGSNPGNLWPQISSQLIISLNNIQVERVEVKDVRLPHQLQRAMAAEAEASREARAKVIGAEGEQKAARYWEKAS